MQIKLVLLILFGIFSVESDAQDCTIDDVFQLLAKNQVAAEFKQTKIILALSRPLNSTGVIWLSDKNQLLWQTLKPLRSTIVIEQNRVKQFDPNDRLINQNSHQMVNKLSHIFLGLITGNAEALTLDFSTSVSCEDKQWTLTLTANSQEVMQLIKNIRLKGSDELQQIEFEETRGDKTSIALTHSGELTAAQFGRYFE